MNSLCKIFALPIVLFFVVPNNVSSDDKDEQIHKLRAELEGLKKNYTNLKTVNEDIKKNYTNLKTVNEDIKKNNTELQLISRCGPNYRMVHHWLEYIFMNWEFVSLHDDYYAVVNQMLKKYFEDTYLVGDNTNENRNPAVMGKIQLNFCEIVYKRSPKRFKWIAFLKWLTESDEYTYTEECSRIIELATELRSLLKRKITIENLADCISFHWKLSTKMIKYGDHFDTQLELKLLNFTSSIYETFIGMSPDEIKFPMRNEYFLQRFCGELFRRTISQADITLGEKEQVEPFPEWFKKGDFESQASYERTLRQLATAHKAGRATKKKKITVMQKENY